jgi:hypothetical protein
MWATTAFMSACSRLPKLSDYVRELQILVHTLPLCLSACMTGMLAPGAAKPKAGGLGLSAAAERAAAAAAGALRSATAASDAAKAAAVAVPGRAPRRQCVAAGAAGERLRADAAGVLGARPRVCADSRGAVP